MSQTSPFSVRRSLSRGTVAEVFGSSSGNEFAQDSAAYRDGLKFLSATTDTGFAVIPTHASPWRANCLPEMVHPRFKSNEFEGFNISTATVPLNFARSAGRRTSTRVVYGTLGVRTTAGPGSGQS